MDDFMFLADSYDATLLLRRHVDSLLARLGLPGIPKKGIWTPTQVRDQIVLTIDFDRGEFRAPQDKLHVLAKQAYALLGRDASKARQLAAFAGKAHFFYLAIAPARFFLRDLHNFPATRCVGEDASD
jgi:hypothetical protein